MITANRGPDLQPATILYFHPWIFVAGNNSESLIYGKRQEKTAFLWQETVFLAGSFVIILFAIVAVSCGFGASPRLREDKLYCTNHPSGSGSLLGTGLTFYRISSPLILLPFPEFTSFPPPLTYNYFMAGRSIIIGAGWVGSAPG
jgi:hypothetical protein